MIVITGLGAVTALGATAPETWERIVRGERAFTNVSLFKADDYRVRLVAEVSGLPREGGDGFSRTGELGLRAAREALADAGFESAGARPRRFGLVMGGSTAGMLETESTLAVILSPEGAVDPAIREQALCRMLSHPLSAPTDRLARELGRFTRVRSLSSACSSGANALLVGATWLELGLVDAVLCGAADALCRVTLSGFNALGALDPDGARPFDRRRRGLTLGEGAGFVVLERAAEARARGKDAICSLLGWAARAEAHHITNPEPSGSAPSRAMLAALARAGLGPSDIDYVNAHGTGTPLNDPMESRALARVFAGDLARVPVSSQKGQIGHTLASAGAIEATFTALAIARGILPPTGGLEEPDPECPLAHVLTARASPIRAALSSSFGFGGMDTVLVFGRSDAQAPPVPARRAVVVTGAAAITPAGLIEGAEVGALPSRTEARDEITFDVEASLDRERARRLD
ncbi:MAG TPA: beta-ketoacyl-[acyl-carrier-protein] synthase family protein, partial [Labilithrix sp.]|nr:beta-ketoacyl-[acyl-carrier-protein] synthase family protein [Labilithrix sp.]